MECTQIVLEANLSHASADLFYFYSLDVAAGILISESWWYGLING